MRRLEGWLGRWWVWAAAFALVAASAGPRLASLGLAWAGSAGSLGPLAYGALHVAGALLGLPAAPLTIGGGFLFGGAEGALYAGIGSTLGACLSFGLGRTVSRAGAFSTLSSSPAMSVLRSALGREGFRIVFFARLAPAFPFNPAVYAFALAGMPFRTFAAATFLGTPLCALLFSMVGAAAAGLGPRPSALHGPWALASWVATVAALVLMHGAFSRALDQERGEAWKGLRTARAAGGLAMRAARALAGGAA